MKRSQILLLGLIIVSGLFFRTYQVVERADFGHDADLYSWIVKDIVVNGHLRLVGQETSASGIFIGPLFYYSLVPFYLLLNMDPVAAHFPITIIGILTVISYFVVFSKLFNTKVGFIASLLYAVLISAAVWFDRRLAPSTPTNLWTIWYFYTVIMLARGKFNVLLLLGILIGLIWHIHIALLPALFAIPFAFLKAKKLPSFSQLVEFSIAVIITSLPLIIFELRHNFQQTTNLLQNFTTVREGARGLYKFQTVLEMITKNINSLFFAPQFLPITNTIFFPMAILASSFLLVKKKLLKTYELIPLLAWVFSVVLFFSVSSSPISEYYFYDIEIVFLTIVSLLLFYLFNSSRVGKILVVGLLMFVTAKNVFFLIVQDTYHKGYIEKKSVVNYIINDAKTKNFPCFSLNYITSPGENVGFRYFFFLKKAHIAVPGRGSPVYSIVIPDEYSLKEVKVKFGHIGVIPPKQPPPQELMTEACSGQNTNLTDPMFGYVE
ncbi:glycosyltransferase family 39 protein [Candidatus Daviesbacteria bacterium]|nr:glycosyltransferase family 39 protein [Candidatus Daviesbacteria bacterium]